MRPEHYYTIKLPTDMRNLKKAGRASINEVSNVIC